MRGILIQCAEATLPRFFLDGTMPRYWLMKSEPSECSIDDVLAMPDRTVAWWAFITERLLG